MRNQESERGPISAIVEGKLDSLTDSVRKVADEWMTYQLRGEKRGESEKEREWVTPQTTLTADSMSPTVTWMEPTPIFWPHLCLIRYNLCVIEWEREREREREREEKRGEGHFNWHRATTISTLCEHSPEGRFTLLVSPLISLLVSLSLSLSLFLFSPLEPPSPLSTFVRYFWAWAFASLLFLSALSLFLSIVHVYMASPAWW